MNKYYIRLFSNGKDIARTFTLLEALYVAQSESMKEGGLYENRILTVTHNRKVVCYIQGYHIVREPNANKSYSTPESFVGSLV